MKAPEIADAVAALAEQPFDSAEFPYQFLEAYGYKSTSIRRLRTGNMNRTDIPGAVLRRDHIHIATAEPGETTNKLSELRDSPATTRQKARFILATDGHTLEAQDLHTGDLLAIDYPELANNFVMFFPIAGITITREFKNTDIDIRATNGLNKLYVE